MIPRASHPGPSLSYLAVSLAAHTKGNGEANGEPKRQGDRDGRRRDREAVRQGGADAPRDRRGDGGGAGDLDGFAARGHRPRHGRLAPGTEGGGVWPVAVGEDEARATRRGGGVEVRR